MAGRKKSPTKCKLLLQNQIKDNIADYNDWKQGWVDVPLNRRFKSRAQAIAVAYSQINKEHPRCIQHIKSRKSRKSKRKSRKSKRNYPLIQDIIKKIQNKTATAADKRLYKLMQAGAVNNAKRHRTKKSTKTKRKSSKRKVRKFRVIGGCERGGARIHEILQAHDITYTTDALKCIVNGLLAISLAASLPLAAGGEDRVLGIREAPLIGIEWWELSTFGVLGFNFGKRGNPDGISPPISQEFKNTLYPPGPGIVRHELLRGQSVLRQMARGAYYLFNRTRDEQAPTQALQHIQASCAEAANITNREVRIIARIAFGLPVFDGMDPTPWPITEMISMGYLTADGTVFDDHPTAIVRKVALKELITNPMKVFTKLSKYEGSDARIGTEFSEHIKANIDQIKRENGIIDGVIDDITGAAAAYPSYTINSVYLQEAFATAYSIFSRIEGQQGDYLRQNIDHQLLQQIDAAKIKIAPGSPGLDVGYDTISRMNEILEVVGMEIAPSALVTIDVSADERAFDKAAHQAWMAQLTETVRTNVKAYVEKAASLCGPPSAVSDQFRWSLGVSEIVRHADYTAWATGKIPSPTEICANMQHILRR